MYETPWDNVMTLKARRKSSAPTPALSEFDLSGMLFPGNASQDKLKKKRISPASLLFSSTIPEDTDLGYYVKAENLTPGMTHGLDYAPTYPGAEILSVSENLGGRVKVRYVSPNWGEGREGTGISDAIIAADKYCFILRQKVRVHAGPSTSGKRLVGRPRKVQSVPIAQGRVSPASLLFGASANPPQEKTAKVSPASLLFG